MAKEAMSAEEAAAHYAKAIDEGIDEAVTVVVIIADPNPPRGGGISSNLDQLPLADLLEEWAKKLRAQVLS